jgi:RNA polymerase sigma factor for flagellar operon FliA
MPERVIENHLGLVRVIARQIGKRIGARIEIEDLEQEGMLGLIDAAAKYDESLGVPFSAYAAQRIRGAIIDSVRNISQLSRKNMALSPRVQEAQTCLRLSLQREPEPSEIAAVLEISLEAYEKFRREVFESSASSLSDLIPDGDGLTLEDVLAGNGEDAYRAVFAAEEVRRALRHLTRRERSVVLMLYRDELTPHEIAARLGCVPSRISQMRTNITRKLRSLLTQGDRRLRAA